MRVAIRLLLLLAVLLSSTAFVSALPGRAEVKRIVGQATKTDAKGSTVALIEGMILGTGDSITTGLATTVDLYLGLNGDALRVDPESTLRIDVLEIDNAAKGTVTTKLTIGKGAILGNVVRKLNAASKYEIKTASGIAGVRGTIYSAGSDGSLVVAKGGSIVHPGPN